MGETDPCGRHTLFLRRIIRTGHAVEHVYTTVVDEKERGLSEEQG